MGGITRLTRSGLSMTDWKLQGSLPPMNEKEWTEEFERYKQFPEYKQRQSMTLEEFKYIYFWEYSHRMMGRGLGVAFALPAAYFYARGMIPRHLLPRIVGLFGLGGAQVMCMCLKYLVNSNPLLEITGSHRLVDGEIRTGERPRLQQRDPC